MSAAIWSCPLEVIKNYPAKSLVRFFLNHGLLQVTNQCQWYTVEGGSKEYVKLLCQDFKERIFLNSKIEKIYDIPGKYNKHDSIVQNKVRPTIYEHIKDMSYCERQKFLRSYYLEFTVLFFDLLNDNGNVFISMFSFCDEYVIEFIYILASMFDYIIIYDATYVYCDNFRGNKSLISKKDVKKFIKSDKSSITPKNNLKELLEYIERSYINKIEFNKLLLNKKYDEYIDKRISYMYDYLKEIHIDHKILNIFYKKMLTTLKKAFIGKGTIKNDKSVEKLKTNT
jgi:hypothetical protein